MAESDSKLLIRIENYCDPDPQAPTGYLRFLNRMLTVQGTAASQWGSIVIDMVTSMEIMARKYHQYVLNPTTREPRQWWSGTTDTLEENLYVRCGSLRTNVCVLAHVDKDKSQVASDTVSVPNAPGRLRGGLPGGFSELYYAYVSRDNEGTLQYLLQTQNDGRFAASSQIDAPNPVAVPRTRSPWREIYSNWNGAKRIYWHGLVYGDSGTGKSSFARWLPKPQLVLCFEGLGKDTPYLKLGDIRAEYDEFNCTCGNQWRGDSDRADCPKCGQATFGTFVREVWSRPRVA